MKAILFIMILSTSLSIAGIKSFKDFSIDTNVSDIKPTYGQATGPSTFIRSEDISLFVARKLGMVEEPSKYIEPARAAFRTPLPAYSTGTKGEFNSYKNLHSIGRN